MVEGDTDTVEFGALETVLAEPGTQMRIFGKPEVHGHRRMAVVLATDRYNTCRGGIKGFASKNFECLYPFASVINPSQTFWPVF